MKSQGTLKDLGNQKSKARTHDGGDYYKKSRHTREICWKLNGKPSLNDKGKTSFKKTFQGSIVEEHEPVTNSQSLNKTLVIKGQLELLYKMFGQTRPSSSFFSFCQVR
ncbi:Calcineurin B-like protein [Melia azedarach]|uniref:Calcineurin B-like protein n=1 Tax=Melia azedarach TaxID=155640 RepID=A0ACC1WPZ2_MELAZ|nr:Calcineurin B-like protein [Melia azedarach]